MLCPFIPPLLLSLSGCRLNLSIYSSSSRAELWVSMLRRRRGCCRRVAHHGLLDWLHVWNVSGGWSTVIMEKENKREFAVCLQELMQACCAQKTGFPSVLRFTRCLTVAAWMAFIQRVDRRKRLGGAESRSAGDSVGPIPSRLSHLKTRKQSSLE